MTDTFQFGGDIVWRPTPDYIEGSHLQVFMRQHGLGSFDALMQRSTSDVPWFTDAVLKYLKIQFQRPYQQVLDMSAGPAWPKWCVGGKLNIVYNCVDKYLRDSTLARKPAILWEADDGKTESMNYADLYREVNHCANLLREMGYRKGDVIGLFMPMSPEIVIALLGIGKIGAVALPLFSGFGPSAITARLHDAQAKGLVTMDGFFRRGQVVGLKAIADEAVAQTPAVRKVLVVRRAGIPVTMLPGRDQWWHELMPLQSSFAALEETDAEDPLLLLYTSGTTGKPKGALHTHCGFPVKAAQDMAFGTNVRAGDRMYWITDMGWMMGPWLVYGTLLLGATMVLSEGVPDYPGPERLWQMVDRHQVTHLGISPTLVRSLLKFGDAPVRQSRLNSLRYLASTGEPWNPDPWLWLFNTVGRGKLPIINYSGGTEISGGIVMGNPLLPLKPCAFSGPCPGMAADVVDDYGHPVRNQVGELVIRAPWIGMTRGFWRDRQRYEETYWQRFPGLWVHGDFAAIDQDGQWYILGRSDDTIKVAGKRVGPAEIESVLVSHPAVLEAAAIGVPDEVKGSAVVCFCVLSPGHTASDELRHALMASVGSALGKPLTPRDVRFVNDLPKTRNAKVMRRIIRAAFLGLEPGDTSSLENAAAVDDIRQSG